jgi:hypothetical protein
MKKWREAEQSFSLAPDCPSSLLRRFLCCSHFCAQSALQRLIHHVPMTNTSIMEDDIGLALAEEPLLPKKESRQEEPDDDERNVRWGLLHGLFPVLLSVQFSLALYMNPQSMEGLNVFVVNISVLTAALGAYLYRNTMEEFIGDIESSVLYSVVMIVPEIVMDVALMLNILADPVTAFMVLIYSMLALAIVVALCSIRLFFLPIEQHDNFAEPEEREKATTTLFQCDIV